MQMLRPLGRMVNRTLAHVGLRVSRLHADLLLEAALARHVRRGVEVATVIDVGASDGRWSERVRPFFPQARYLLIDANPTHTPQLQTYQRSHPEAEFTIAAAGDHEGEIYFDAHDPLGGVASTVDQPGYIRVPMTTLDAEVKRRSLPAPYFIKLDTHGFEMPILAGASHTLLQTTMLLIETYNFKIQPNSLRFYEMCSHLAAHGFQPIDLVEPMHRVRDGALWQFDLLFVPSSRPEFEVNTYL